MAIRTRQYVTKVLQPNLWLGQPATVQWNIPTTAGIQTQYAATHLAGVAGAAVSPSLVNTSSTYSYIELQNRGASSTALALVGFLPDSYWQAGQWVASGTTYTDDTTDAQDADTNDFALETTTVNDGFIVGATVPFGALSVDVTTAGSGTTPTHTFEFWNGTAWTGILAVGLLVDVPRSLDWAAGEALVLFDTPAVWAKGGSGTGVPQGLYNIRIVRTNAVQATAALARRIYVGITLFSIDAVAANGSYIPIEDGGTLDIPDYIPYVGLAVGATDAGNNLTVVQKVIEQV